MTRMDKAQSLYGSPNDVTGAILASDVIGESCCEAK